MVDNFPPQKKKEIPTGLRESLGGFLRLGPIRAGLTSQAHFTGDPGLAGPWVLDKLGIPIQEPGLSFLERKYGSVHPLSASCPEGRGFPGKAGRPLWNARRSREEEIEGRAGHLQEERGKQGAEFRPPSVPDPAEAGSSPAAVPASSFAPGVSIPAMGCRSWFPARTCTRWQAPFSAIAMPPSLSV